MKNTAARYYIPVILLIGVFSFNTSWASNDKNSRLYRPVDNWNVDGANGVLHVSGSLTESACRISMDSANQTIELGNTETANLPEIGSKARSIPFHIRLLDCIEMKTSLSNLQTGQTAWSQQQPAVKIRFTAPTTPFMPNLASVTGVQGLGLEISSDQGNILPLNRQSNPLLLTPGDNLLTYYVTPVRISKDIVPGAYTAVISFEMLYE